jgi:hypothetical protein
MRLTSQPLSTPPLTEKHAKVCTLIVEGNTDRKIMGILRIGRPTLRKYIKDAAKHLCKHEPVACRVFPRQTIVAYYTERSGSAEPEQVFKHPPNA